MAVSAIAEGGAGDPHALVAETLRRLPGSPAATFLGASLQHAVADWDRAIELYDRTLALKPAHEDAWAGRTISLTELGRHEEAIDAATRMIDLKLDNVDQALYWRAWNHHARGDLTEARADIEDARAPAPVGRDPDARRASSRTTRRISMRPGRDLDARHGGWGRVSNCRADWYLGIRARQAAAVEGRGAHVRGRDDLLRHRRQGARARDPHARGENRRRSVFKQSRIARLRARDSGCSAASTWRRRSTPRTASRSPAISRRRGR